MATVNFTFQAPDPDNDTSLRERMLKAQKAARKDDSSAVPKIRESFPEGEICTIKKNWGDGTFDCLNGLGQTMTRVPAIDVNARHYLLEKYTVYVEYYEVNRQRPHIVWAAPYQTKAVEVLALWATFAYDGMRSLNGRAFTAPSTPYILSKIPDGGAPDITQRRILRSNGGILYYSGGGVHAGGDSVFYQGGDGESAGTGDVSSILSVDVLANASTVPTVLSLDQHSLKEGLVDFVLPADGSRLYIGIWSRFVAGWSWENRGQDPTAIVKSRVTCYDVNSLTTSIWDVTLPDHLMLDLCPCLDAQEDGLHLLCWDSTSAYKLRLHDVVLSLEDGSTLRDVVVPWTDSPNPFTQGWGTTLTNWGANFAGDQQIWRIAGQQTIFPSASAAIPAAGGDANYGTRNNNSLTNCYIGTDSQAAFSGEGQWVPQIAPDSDALHTGIQAGYPRWNWLIGLSAQVPGLYLGDQLAAFSLSDGSQLWSIQGRENLQAPPSGVGDSLTQTLVNYTPVVVGTLADGTERLLAVEESRTLYTKVVDVLDPSLVSAAQFAFTWGVNDISVYPTNIPFIASTDIEPDDTANTGSNVPYPSPPPSYWKKGAFVLPATGFEGNTYGLDPREPADGQRFRKKFLYYIPDLGYRDDLTDLITQLTSRIQAIYADAANHKKERVTRVIDQRANYISVDMASGDVMSRQPISDLPDSTSIRREKIGSGTWSVVASTSYNSGVETAAVWRKNLFTSLGLKIVDATDMFFADNTMLCNAQAFVFGVSGYVPSTQAYWVGNGDECHAGPPCPTFDAQNQPEYYGYYHTETLSTPHAFMNYSPPVGVWFIVVFGLRYNTEVVTGVRQGPTPHHHLRAALSSDGQVILAPRNYLYSQFGIQPDATPTDYDDRKKIWVYDGTVLPVPYDPPQPNLNMDYYRVIVSGGDYSGLKSALVSLSLDTCLRNWVTPWPADIDDVFSPSNDEVWRGQKSNPVIMGDKVYILRETQSTVDPGSGFPADVSKQLFLASFKLIDGSALDEVAISLEEWNAQSPPFAVCYNIDTDHEDGIIHDLGTWQQVGEPYAGGVTGLRLMAVDGALVTYGNNDQLYVLKKAG